MISPSRLPKVTACGFRSQRRPRDPWRECQRMTGNPFRAAECQPYPVCPSDMSVTNDLHRQTGQDRHGSDLHFLVELRGFEPLTPSMRTMQCWVHPGAPRRLQRHRPVEMSSGGGLTGCRCAETGTSTMPSTQAGHHPTPAQRWPRLRRPKKSLKERPPNKHSLGPVQGVRDQARRRRRHARGAQR